MYLPIIVHLSHRFDISRQRRFWRLRAAQVFGSELVDVILIDRRNYHLFQPLLFQPLLYQVATGSLSPGQISAPLRSVLSRQKNTRVLLGSVEDVDPDTKQVDLVHQRVSQGCEVDAAPANSFHTVRTVDGVGDQSLHHYH